MFFGADGNVHSCCVNRSYILGSYPEHELIQIWKGNKIRKFRRYMKRNDLNHGCHECKYWLEKGNSEALLAPFYDHLEIPKRFPAILEFELSNSCNLECIMCFGQFSSSILKNREQLPPIKMQYDENFVHQLENFIPHLKETIFKGGEPFLINIYYQIWEKIIELNPDCVIYVQTNATILNNRIKEMLNRANFRMAVSIDSLKKEIFEKIRINAHFDQVIENIRYLADYSNNKNNAMIMAVCPMRMNWKEIPDIMDFCYELKAIIRFNTVWFPAKHSLWNLSANELKEIHDHLSLYHPKESGINSEINKNRYKEFLNQLVSWYEDALKKQIERDSLIKVEIDELKDNIIRKIESFISDSEQSFGGSTESIRDICVEKLNSVFNMFSDESDLKFILLELNNYQIEMIVEQLQNNSIEILLEYAKSALGEKNASHLAFTDSQ